MQYFTLFIYPLCLLTLFEHASCFSGPPYSADYITEKFDKTREKSCLLFRKIYESITAIPRRKHREFSQFILDLALIGCEDCYDDMDYDIFLEQKTIQTLQPPIPVTFSMSSSSTVAAGASDSIQLSKNVFSPQMPLIESPDLMYVPGKEHSEPSSSFSSSYDSVSLLQKRMHESHCVSPIVSHSLNFPRSSK